MIIITVYRLNDNQVMTFYRLQHWLRNVEITVHYYSLNMILVIHDIFVQGLSFRKKMLFNSDQISTKYLEHQVTSKSQGVSALGCGSW